jgi:DNA-binding Lrp family transcriptional regulator
MAQTVAEPAEPGGQMALDDTDRKIIDALRADGRISMRTLAARLHISRASAYARVERLEQSGVITGYTVTIDPQRYGYGLSAYVYLKISQHSWKSVREKVLAITEVEHGALVAGESDIVLLIRTRDAGSLRDLLLTKLHQMPGIVSTQTVVIFDELLPVPGSTAAINRSQADAPSGPARLQAGGELGHDFRR